MAPNIINLLPQKSDSLLINRKKKLSILTITSILVELSIEAIESFINRDFHKFDAQVGENLCQIRTCKILSLATKTLFYQEMAACLPKLHYIRQRILFRRLLQ